MFSVHSHAGNYYAYYCYYLFIWLSAFDATGGYIILSVQRTVACVKSSKKRIETDTHTLTHRERNCTRCRLLHLHASWPCKMQHHTDFLSLLLWLWLTRSLAFWFWQSWYYYEGRNLTVATHEAHNASRLLAINYTKSLEKLFQLKRPMLKTSRLTINFYLQIKCL